VLSALLGFLWICGKQTTCNLLRICTYKKSAPNSRKIRTSQEPGRRLTRAARAQDASPNATRRQLVCSLSLCSAPASWRSPACSRRASEAARWIVRNVVRLFSGRCAYRAGSSAAAKQSLCSAPACLFRAKSKGWRSPASSRCADASARWIARAAAPPRFARRHRPSRSAHNSSARRPRRLQTAPAARREIS
jgi:hypothetical protein